MADINAAFNDIGLVDIQIKSSKGIFTAKQMGANDVVVLLSPGNGGDVYNVVEGSTGQLLANKSYKVKNWSVTIRFLRHSYDYCRATWLIEDIINGKIKVVGIDIVNNNFGTSDGTLTETLTAPQAFLVNFAGLEAGAGASGDFEVTFKCAGAEYTAGAYNPETETYKEEVMRDKGGMLAPEEA